MENFFNTLLNWSPLLTVFVSGIISYLIAKFNAKNEIKKALLSMNHETRKTMNSAFSECIFNLERYQKSSAPISRFDAIRATAEFMAIAPKELHPILIELDSALASDNKYQSQKLRDELFAVFSQHVQNSD